MLAYWQEVLKARNPSNPQSDDYIQDLFSTFEVIQGDGLFRDDPSIIAGFGYIDDQKWAFLGIKKGKKTKEKVECQFGMPNPEGYRKAQKLMNLAQRFSIPLVTFIDTPGAYPGIEAEERGQSRAIAEILEFSSSLTIPMVSFIIGEGGSGGALALALGNKVYMLEHSIYSVISPESCAAILWPGELKEKEAAYYLKILPQDLLEMKLIDGIVKKEEIKKILKKDLKEIVHPQQERLIKFRNIDAHVFR